MKKLLVILLMGVISLQIHAQGYEWKKPPQPNEKVIEIIKVYVDAGDSTLSPNPGSFLADYRLHDDRRTYTEEQLYEKCKYYAQRNYGEKYPSFALREFKSSLMDNIPEAQTKYKKEGYFSYSYRRDTTHRYVLVPALKMEGSISYYRFYLLSATLVVPDYTTKANNNLKDVIDKATKRVNYGSVFAIGDFSVSNDNEIDKESIKDEIIDILLEKGFRVAAKEQHQKLYNEWKQQRQIIYNEETVVPTNNLSAVGYFLNVKITDKILRIQVINVSNGEYEGTATINF